MTIDKNKITQSQLSRSLKVFSTLEDAFNKQHNYKYDYSKSVYTGVDNPIIIICPEHGEFEQTPYRHRKSKTGCPECLKNETSNRIRSNITDFIIKSRSIHKDKYSYENTIYKGSKNKVIITCPIHGDFNQTPNDHLQGCGCPQCAKENICKKYFMKETTLYYVYIEKVNLYKIGITINKDPLKRFSKEKQLGIKLLYSKVFPTGKDAYIEEQRILKLHKENRYNGKPFFSKGGESECFNIDILNLNKDIYNE